MRRLGVEICALILLTILPGETHSSPSLLDDLLEDTYSDPHPGCGSYKGWHWNQIRQTAREKLHQLKEMKERGSERMKRDSYGHDDTQVVVRCKHGYTGRLDNRYMEIVDTLL